jgi:hypothetical protein
MGSTKNYSSNLFKNEFLGLNNRKFNFINKIKEHIASGYRRENFYAI